MSRAIVASGTGGVLHERLRALQARFFGVERREDDPVGQWMRVNVAGDCEHGGDA